MSANNTNLNRFCCAKNCFNRRESGLSFFGFPRDDIRCKEWLELAKRDDLSHKSAAQLYRGRFVLCGAHFTNDQFYNPKKPNRLLHNARPTLFPTKPSGSSLEPFCRSPTAIGSRFQETTQRAQTLDSSADPRPLQELQNNPSLDCGSLKQHYKSAEIDLDPIHSPDDLNLQENTDFRDDVEALKDRSALRDDAIRTRFPYQKKTKQCPSNDSKHTVDSIEMYEIDIILPSCRPLQDLKDLSDIKLPSQFWKTFYFDRKVVFCKCQMNEAKGICQISIQLVLNQVEKTTTKFTCNIFIRDIEIEIVENIESKELIESKLVEVDMLRICSGAGHENEFGNINASPNQIIADNIVYHKLCEVGSHSTGCKFVCSPCKHLRRQLQHKRAYMYLKSSAAAKLTKEEKHKSIHKKCKEINDMQS